MAAPTLLLCGGEATVSIGTGSAGRGGRNTEFLLGLVIAIAGASDIWAVAGDSDGIDGTEDAAEALIGPDSAVTLKGTSEAPAGAAGLDARAFLVAYDSYTFLDRLGDLLRTSAAKFEVPIDAAANSSWELQISKPHWKSISSWSSFDSKVRSRGRRDILRTSGSKLQPHPCERQ